MKTNSELQAELDSALRAVTSLAAERNAARAEAEDLRGRLAQDHGIIAGMEEGANELNEVNDNLVLLLRRTSRRLPPFDPLRVQAVDFLKRIGQAGNELRAPEDWKAEALVSPNVAYQPRPSNSSKPTP